MKRKREGNVRSLTDMCIKVVVDNYETLDHKKLPNELRLIVCLGRIDVLEDIEYDLRDRCDDLGVDIFRYKIDNAYLRSQMADMKDELDTLRYEREQDDVICYKSECRHSHNV
jgi:hypothetical protein